MARPFSPHRFLLMAASLVPCGMAAWLWVHSYAIGEDVEWGTNDQRYVIGVREGRLALCRYGIAKYYRYRDPGEWRRTTNPNRDNPFGPSLIWESDWRIRLPGFRFAGDIFGSHPGTLVVVHFAYVVLCLAAAPFAAAAGLRRLPRWRRRQRKGCCPACGYDCRATPHAAGPLLAVCPECGHPQPDPAAA